MPGKADKTLQNSAIQGILRVTTSLICQYACIIGYLATVATSSDSEIEQENFMIKVLFICHGNILTLIKNTWFYSVLGMLQ